MTRPLAALIVAITLATPAAADPTIKNVQVGKVLHGPPISYDQLEGVVVFVEEWGIH
jgi:hypothetical protein